MPNIDIHIRRKRPKPPSQNSQQKKGPVDAKYEAEYLKRRGGGATFIDLGQVKVGGTWETVAWTLHRNIIHAGPDEVPGTESFDESGGAATHNANFTGLSLEQLRARRVRTRTQSEFYEDGRIEAGAFTYELNSSASWRGNRVAIPSQFYGQEDFRIAHGNALFAPDIVIKGPDKMKVTSTPVFTDPEVPFTPAKNDTYFLVPIPAQHLASATGGNGGTAIVDVSAFRYRPRVDLDNPSIVVEWVAGTPVADPSGYAKFLQAVEFQSGLPDMDIWFVPENDFPSPPFQFVSTFPTTASAFNTLLTGRTDFADREYRSVFGNLWFSDDEPEGVLVLIIGQGNNLFYVWSQFT